MIFICHIYEKWNSSNGPILWMHVMTYKKQCSEYPGLLPIFIYLVWDVEEYVHLEKISKRNSIYKDTLTGPKPHNL